MPLHPQAAIYLTVKIDWLGGQRSDVKLVDQAAVTSYILSEAKLAVVPFMHLVRIRVRPGTG